MSAEAPGPRGGAILAAGGADAIDAQAARMKPLNLKSPLAVLDNGCDASR
jgi:hypothetical protein